MAAIGGGVSGGIGAGAFGTIAKVAGNGFMGAVIAGAVTGAASSAISQGLDIAGGLQKSFNWTDVATASAGSAAGAGMGEQMQGEFNLGSSNLNTAARDVVSGAAGVIASAATRSLITGTDFGDNIIATLPSAIPNTIGNMFGREAEESDLSNQLQDGGMPSNAANALANGAVTGDMTDVENLPIGSDMATGPNAIRPVIVTPAVDAPDPIGFERMFGADVGARVLALARQSSTLWNALAQLKREGSEIMTNDPSEDVNVGVGVADTHLLIRSQMALHKPSSQLVSQIGQSL